MDIHGIQTLVSVLIGGGILGFIEFLLKRKYEKEDKHDAVIDAIKELDEKVDERFNTLDKKIDVIIHDENLKDVSSESSAEMKDDGNTSSLSSKTIENCLS